MPKSIWFPHNEVPDIPGWLFECPKCGDLLTCEIDEWEQMEDGSWRVSECGLHLSCASEPEIGSKNWDEWFNWHFDMPYVYWLPLQAKVWAWFNESYRFEPSNIACTGQVAGADKADGESTPSATCQ